MSKNNSSKLTPMRFWQLTPRILLLFPEEEYIPFILFHRSGVMRTFARMAITLTIEGLSFSTIEQFIKIQRQQKMSSVQLQVMSMLGLHHNQNFSPEDLATIVDFQSHTQVMICSVSAFLQTLQRTMDLLLSNVFSVNIHLHRHRPHI